LLGEHYAACVSTEAVLVFDIELDDPHLIWLDNELDTATLVPAREGFALGIVEPGGGPICPADTFDESCVVRIDLESGEMQHLEGFQQIPSMRFGTMQPSPDRETIVVSATDGIYRASIDGEGATRAIALTLPVRDLSW
jgi:hypothetical protein